MNFSHILMQDSPVLVATFLLLAVMSLASWTIIFYKSWLLFRERKLLAGFQEQYATLPDWPLRVNYMQAENSQARVLGEEASRLREPLSSYDQSQCKNLYTMHLSQKLDRVRTYLDQGLTILASIGSSAPFIGLFGTVWGVYGALMQIAQQGNAGLNVVSGPMGEALIATAVGLFTAIPAVLAYNGFVRMNRLLVQDLRHVAEQLATYLSLSDTTPRQHDNIRPMKIVQEK